MKYDKDKIKESLTIEQVFDFCAEMGGEPHMEAGGDIFVMRTICHNHPGEGSHKCYYYNNTHLFRCYTNCGSMDIFQLYTNIQKVAGYSVELPQAVAHIASYFGLAADYQNFSSDDKNLEDWKILENYDKIETIVNKEKQVEMKFYDDKILSYYPFIRYKDWEREGISPDIMKKRGIHFDPATEAMLIPHYDINNNLVGIRSRTIVKEDEIYGKYRPSVLNGKMYNHPLGFNLYNLNWSKNNILLMKKAIVFEGEKSCLKYASFFGEENDISVAVCGSSLIQYQVDLLLSLGVTELVIAFDKQWQEKGDDEFKKWTAKLTEINKKYSSKVLVTFVFDKDGTNLEYKMSPVDAGPDTFMKLFKERIKI